MARLSSILGPDSCAEWARDPVNGADLQDLLHDEWETCKRAFDGSTGMHVNLPGSLLYAAPDHAVRQLDAAGYSDRWGQGSHACMQLPVTACHVLTGSAIGASVCHLSQSDYRVCSSQILHLPVIHCHNVRTYQL